MSHREEVDWERLDKRKFFVNGVAIFSSLTAALFPLTVIKTRMMALDGAPTGLSGAITTARQVVRHDGFKGLYKGFGTVILGAIPARIVYLSALESTKSAISSSLNLYPSLSSTFIASSANFVAGGVASLAGQLVVVPVDVISQRLMIMDGKSTQKSVNVNGLSLAQKIIREEGVRGLYRGFGASIATFVPSSAIWWSAYGGWQTFLWNSLDRLNPSSRSSFTTFDGELPIERSQGQIIGVEIVAGVLTGCTSASLTTPLDVVKTRLQTTAHAEGGVKPSWRGTAVELLRAEGASGLFRGLVPRMISTSIWGTAMVTTYEFLKRLCVLEDVEKAKINP